VLEALSLSLSEKEPKVTLETSLRHLSTPATPGPVLPCPPHSTGQEAAVIDTSKPFPSSADRWENFPLPALHLDAVRSDGTLLPGVLSVAPSAIPRRGRGVYLGADADALWISEASTRALAAALSAHVALLDRLDAEAAAPDSLKVGDRVILGPDSYLSAPGRNQGGTGSVGVVTVVTPRAIGVRFDAWKRPTDSAGVGWFFTSEEAPRVLKRGPLPLFTEGDRVVVHAYLGDDRLSGPGTVRAVEPSDLPGGWIYRVDLDDTAGILRGHLGAVLETELGFPQKPDPRRFAVGDTVRIVGGPYLDRPELVGTVATVIEVRPRSRPYPYLVRHCNLGTIALLESEIERVAIVPGDRVRIGAFFAGTGRTEGSLATVLSVRPSRARADEAEVSIRFDLSTGEWRVPARFLTLLTP
jgi:hypothetical protein